MNIEEKVEEKSRKTMLSIITKCYIKDNCYIHFSNAKNQTRVVEVIKRSP